jgi:hypothetical protein
VLSASFDHRVGTGEQRRRLTASLALKKTENKKERAATDMEE